MLHADVKPDNIMVEPAEAAGGWGGGGWGGWGGGGGCGRPRFRFKLIDFSNAMSLAESAAYHDAYDVQTLSYRAPEIIYVRTAASNPLRP